MADPGATWSPARPTRWRGVQMRSRLEAGFAQWADSRGLGPEYEPMAFAGTDGQYLPDFRLSYVQVAGVQRDHPEQGVIWVEVKPVVPAQSDLERLQARMEIIRESEPDAVLAVVTKEPHGGVMFVQRSFYGPWRWALWCRGTPPYNIGIDFPVGQDQMPWADGYWQGPEPGEES